MQNPADQSKAGQQIRNYIEMSDYYLQNFQHSRDSEFSEYDELDLKQIQEARKAQIQSIKGGKDTQNLDIYKVKRRTKVNAGYEQAGLDDIAIGQTDDEEKMFEHFLKKRGDKAKAAEGVRDRQQKVLELNEMIRKYDIKQVRDDEVEKLSNEMIELNLKWGSLKTSLDEKLRFCEKIHKKHTEEVSEYERLSDNLDKGRFNQKVKKITFEILNEKKQVNSNMKEMQEEREKLKIYLDRAKKDLVEEKERTLILMKKLSEIDGKAEETNERMRDQMMKMKSEMEKINNYSIDISKDPARAIQRISDPVLELLNLKVEDYEEQLKENLAQNKKAQQDLIEFRNQIFEEKVKQINLRRIKEEIKQQFKDLSEDISVVQAQTSENNQRKSRLGEKIQQTTEQFKDEARDLREELNAMRQKLITISSHKNIVEDQALYLLDDRGTSVCKYSTSISEFLKLAKELKVKFEAIQDRILKLDMELNTDPLYTVKVGRLQKEVVKPLQEFYKCGRFSEQEKKETLLKDLQKKQEFVIELLKEKEDLEEQLAPFGNIHYIYKTYKEVQEDMKFDIKRYLRDKHQIFSYLENMVADFSINAEKIGRQEGQLKIHIARFKAVFYLMQEKILHMRILEDELVKLKKLSIQSVGNASEAASQRQARFDDGEDEANVYEREVIMRMASDKTQKEREIRSVMQILKAKDMEISNFQSQLDEKGHQYSQEEVLVEQKAKTILERNGFYGAFEMIAKNAFRIGNNCYAYLKLKEHDTNERAVLNERALIVRPQLRNRDALKTLKEYQVDGEAFYDFENTSLKLSINRSLVPNLDETNKQGSNGKQETIPKPDQQPSKRENSNPSGKIQDDSLINLNISNFFGNQKKPKKKGTKKKKSNVAELIVKRAKFYFEKNPTYIKEFEAFDEENICLKQYVEDMQSSRKPFFGYPPVNLEEESEASPKKVVNFAKTLLRSVPKSPEKKDYMNFNEEIKLNQTSDQLPFQEALKTKRKEDRIIDHVLKCFTFGKKVRRLVEDDPEQVSKVDILRRRFKKLDLIREYFSVEKKQIQRKFRYPVNEAADKVDDKQADLYDELQYCLESDPEIRTLPKKHKPPRQKSFIESRVLSKDQERKSIKINLEKHFTSQMIKKETDQVSSDGTFKCFNSDGSIQSVYSSPRQMIDKDLLVIERVLPFDFVTMRKVKRFFDVPLDDIDRILIDPSFGLSKKTKKDRDSQDSDREETNFHEIPELNEEQKLLNKIVSTKRPKEKVQTNIIKGELSSSSEDERYQRYNFAQRVQNTQIRDHFNLLQQMFFQRSQAKNLKYKRAMLDKIAGFKTGITKEEHKVLSERQFVIVDMKSLNSRKINNFNLKQTQQNNSYILPPDQPKNKVELRQESEESEARQSYLSKAGKAYIMRDKAHFKTRNQSLKQVISDQEMTSSFSRISSDNGKARLRGSYQEGRLRLAQNDGQITQEYNTHQSVPGSTRVQNIQIASRPYIDSQARPMQQKLPFALTGSQSTMSSFTNLGFSPQVNTGKNSQAILSQSYQPKQKYQNIAGYNATPYSGVDPRSSGTGQIITTISPTIILSRDEYMNPASVFSQQSPYQELKNSLQNINLTAQQPNIREGKSQTKIRGYLAEKLKKKSVLNCDLFKVHQPEQKLKANLMLNRLNEILGPRSQALQKDT